MLSFFHLVDETDLDRWQSGLERADDSHRPSYARVKQMLAQTQGNCQQASVRWKHASGVVLPVAAWGNLRKPFPRANTRWTFATGAAEQADFRAGIFKAGPSKAVLGRRLANGWPRPTLLAKGVIKAQRAARVLSAAQVEARQLRLRDPDDRLDESEALDRPRQPLVPRRSARRR